ncbi:MAG: hypothetical protein ACLQDY_11180 [Streptosporangiaceae bacterium]
MVALWPVSAASAMPQTPLRPDTPNVYIHLTHAPSYCAAIKNDNNHSGATIWLYKCAQAKSKNWYEVDGVECGDGGQYICSYFIDVKNFGRHSLCLGMNGARKVLLQGCGGNGNEYLTSELWIQDTGPEDGWRNFDWGGMGDLAVAKDRQTDPLYGVDASSGCGGCWYRWSDS